MKIPFTKAHGAGNDFLLTWAHEAADARLPEVALAICERHTGAGADGWMLVEAGGNRDCDAAIRLFNADGSEPEISGNGTRCAAALLLNSGVVEGSELRISTGAGIKHLQLTERDGLRFVFRMNMGRPAYTDEDVRRVLPLAAGELETTTLCAGNPQCAVFVDDFDFDWRAVGAEIERHPFFPNRTNVSFVRVVDKHTIEVRFFERGVGETMSSGTGSTGAAAAAVIRGTAASPIRVLTPAGPIEIVWDGDVFLTGPAQIVACGEFYM